MGEIISLDEYRRAKEMSGSLDGMGINKKDTKEIAEFLAEMDGAYDEFNNAMNEQEQEWWDYLSELTQAPMYIRTRVIQATQQWVMDKNKYHKTVRDYFLEIVNKLKRRKK